MKYISKLKNRACRLLSAVLACVVIMSCFGLQTVGAYASSKAFASDTLAQVQTKKGFIPGKTAAVTNNCYGFAAAVCEKMYGVTYNGEGLYNAYQCRHSSGNYTTVATYKTSHTTPTRSDADDIIDFFVDNAVVGDIVHYGSLGSSSNTHTFIVQSVDNEKLVVYHANYASKGNTKDSCHFDTIYWDSFRSSPTASCQTDDGYSLNAMFYSKMKYSGLGITINRYSKYSSKFYLLTVTVPSVDCSRSSSTSVKLKWSEINSASKYQIQYKKEGDSSYKTASSSCTDLTYDVKNLQTGEKYYFRVRANIGGKWMDYSDSVSKTVLPPTVSSVNFTLTNSAIKMTWGKRSDITGVKIYRSQNKDSGYSLLATVTDNSVSSYCDTDIEYETVYYYKFCRYLDVSNETYSTTSSAKSASYSLKAPSVNAVRLDSQTLKYTFSGDGIQSCYSYYITDSGKNKIKSENNFTSSSLTVSGLTLGETYTLRVREVNSIGKSAYSSNSTKVLTAQVSGVKASYDKNGIALSFNAQSDASKYIIYRSENKNSGFKQIGQTESNKYVDKSVKYNTSYYYRVSSCAERDNAVYTGAMSAVSNACKNSLCEPRISSVRARSNTSVTVKWGKVDGAVNYTVQYKTENGKWKKYATVSGTSAAVKSLNLGSVYCFRVKASNSVGSSGYSSQKSKRVVPVTPAEPTLKKTKNSVKVHWQTNSKISGYKIYRSTSKNGKYKLVNTVKSNKQSSWKDTSVKKNKRYYYKIVYYKNSGKHSYSSSKSPYSTIVFK